MPNHVHGIVIIGDPVGAGHPAPTSIPILEIHWVWMAAHWGWKPRLYGGGTNVRRWGRSWRISNFNWPKQINVSRQTPVAPVWQRNYYEHAIRNEESLNCIRQHILDNPERWAFDRENPQATAPEREEAWRS